MDSGAFVDDDYEGTETRLKIINTIISKLFNQRWLRPSASQENSYEAALDHIARICSNNTDTALEGSSQFCNLKNCSNSTSREQCLKEVLSLLQSMERKRLYDPPSDDEIQYYVRIKRYIRSLITFFDARMEKPGSGYYLAFRNLQFFSMSNPELKSVQEIVELGWHFSDLSTYFSDMDLREGSAINPWMSMKDEEEEEEEEEEETGKDIDGVNYGSKERNNMFYCHKFQLAKMDLCSTEFPFCLPSADEERSYLRVCDPLPAVVNLYEIPIVNPNIYSDELNNLFRARIHQEESNLVRSFRRIEIAIFQKLSIGDDWKYLSKGIISTKHEEIDFAGLGKELAQKYHASDENLPGYITLVDRCLFVASHMHALISSPSHQCFWRVKGASHQQPSSSLREAVGWEALYAAIFLKHGSLTNRVSFQNRQWQQMLPKEVRGRGLHEAKRKCNGASPKERMGTSENVKNLKEIIEKIKIIGCKDVQLQPNQKESQIMNEIWENVASAVFFSFSAMTYELRQFFTEHDLLPSSMRDVIRTKKRNNIKNDKFELEYLKAKGDMNGLFLILASYKNHLLQRLNNKQEMMVVS